MSCVALDYQIYASIFERPKSLQNTSIETELTSNLFPEFSSFIEDPSDWSKSSLSLSKYDQSYVNQRLIEGESCDT